MKAIAGNLILAQKFKIKCSLYSRYYAVACKEWRCPFRGLAPDNTFSMKRRSGGELLASLRPIRPALESSPESPAPRAMFYYSNLPENIKYIANVVHS